MRKTQIVGALVATVLLVLGACAPTPPPAPTPAPTPAPPRVPAPVPAPPPPPPEEPTPTPKPAVVSLKVLSHSSYIMYKHYRTLIMGTTYKGDFFHIVGEFENTSPVNVRLDEDKVKATFYDTSGSVIDAGPVLKDAFRLKILAPGEKSPFTKILLDEEASKRVTSYELLTKGHQTEETPHRAKVLSHRLYEHGSGPKTSDFLVGEVENTTGENVAIRITATFYDEKDTVIAARDFPIYAHGGLPCLAPGEKSPFSLLLLRKEVPSKIERCELLAQWTISDRVLYSDFEVLNPVCEKVTRAGGTWYKIKGEVQNSGKQRATSVTIITTAYNTKGEIIACKSSIPWPNTLGPGEKAPFILDLGPLTPEAGDYVLQVYCYG